MLVTALNAFHVSGIVLATWAVTLTAIGLARHDFPATRAQERIAIAISVLLVAVAIGTGIYTSATEEEPESEPSSESAPEPE